MPDLSEMLGDVYGAKDDQPEATPPTRPAPAWSDDEHLDRAFADWTPGPASDAPAAERRLFADGPDKLADDLAAALSEAVLAETPPSDSVTVPDLRGESAPPAPVEPFAPPAHDTPVAAAPVAEPVAAVEPVQSGAAPAVAAASFTDLEPEAPAAPAVIPAPKPMAWQRDHDDIIPTGHSPRSRSLPRPTLPRRPAKAKPQLGPEGPAPTTSKTPKAGKATKDVKTPKGKEPKAKPAKESKAKGGLWAKLNQPVGGKKK
jgi:hypothetical protein